LDGAGVIWPWAALALVLVLVLLYWLVITTEGTYLGTRAVVAMYDWTARRYNRIKKLHTVYEVYFIGAPLGEALAGVARPLLLDVATGTGRLPLAVLSGEDFFGRIVGVDHALLMLSEATTALEPYGAQAEMVQGDAHALMFGDSAFDAVTCLEALEFMRDPRTVIREMIRVLRPGGVMLVSNRIGWESWLFPGRYCRRGRLESLLRREGMARIDTHLWQSYYDLVWAVKPPAQGIRDIRGTDEA
jgi:SAM-dependent methyltransferase